jgi:hypothetical protein
MVDKVALGQVFSEYFGFPCQFSFHRLLHSDHVSSGTGAMGQLVADVPSRLSLTQLHETKKNTTEDHEAVSLQERLAKLRVQFYRTYLSAATLGTFESIKN